MTNLSPFLNAKSPYSLLFMAIAISWNFFVIEVHEVYMEVEFENLGGFREGVEMANFYGEGLLITLELPHHENRILLFPPYI